MARLHKKVRGRIRNLYIHDGLNPFQIHKRLRIPYSTVYLHTRAVDRDFPSPRDYRAWLARTAGYESYSDYDRTHRVAPKNGHESQRLDAILLARLCQLQMESLELRVDDVIRRSGLRGDLVKRYMSGRHLPRDPELRSRYFRALELEYDTLEEAVQVARQSFISELEETQDFSNQKI